MNETDARVRLTFATCKDVVYMQTAYSQGNRARKEAAQDTPSNGNFDLVDRELQRADCNYSRATPLYFGIMCAYMEMLGT